MNEPKIRLKGFSGEWKETSLGTLSTNCKYGINAPAVSYDGTNKYLRITDIDDKSRIFSQINLTSPGKDLTSCNDYILEDGDITIARTGASVGKSYIYHPVDGKVFFAGFLIRIRLNENIDKRFVFYNTLTSNYSKYIRLVSQRSGQPGINVDELQGYTFKMPSAENEQKSIASYFQHLDSIIQSSEKKIASLKQVKAASLQAMFPQDGATTPKMRFKGFEGEWKRVKLGKLFSERVESDMDAEMLSVTLNNGIIKAAENGRCDNSNSDKSKYKLVRVGDIAYNSMRMWQGASGCSPYEGIVSPAYTVIVPQDGVCSLFFAYLFKTDAIINLFRLHSQGLTKDTWNLKYPAFSQIEVRYPESFAEQQQIAQYFTALDEQMAHESQRLEKLKQVKAACLDMMFV